MRAILTYHSIDDSGSPVSIPPAAFRRHVEWLASGPVRVVSLDELMAPGARGDLVALTFDDGFLNFADEGAPWLLDRGLTATVFVVSDHVGGSNEWGGRAVKGIPSLPLLDWADLARLAERGIAIGSHTRTHPRLAELGPQAVVNELEESRERIARETGVRPAWFAYPYGSSSPAVVAAAGERYRGAVTTDYRVLGSGEDPFRLPRLDAYYFRTPDAFDGWDSPAFHGVVWLRRQARRARRVLERAGGRP